MVMYINNCTSGNIHARFNLALFTLYDMYKIKSSIKYSQKNYLSNKIKFS